MRREDDRAARQCVEVVEASGVAVAVTDTLVDVVVVLAVTGAGPAMR